MLWEVSVVEKGIQRSPGGSRARVQGSDVRKFENAMVVGLVVQLSPPGRRSNRRLKLGWFLR